MCKFSARWLCVTLLTTTLLGTQTAHAELGLLSPEGLKVEYGHKPLGIDAEVPRLSWRSNAGVRNAQQSAYQIQVAGSEAALESGNLLWDSQRQRSDQSLFIPYRGPTLESGQQVFWRVKVWDQHDNASNWSHSASWEMGLLKPADWVADWIKPAGPVNEAEQRPVAHLRTTFEVDGEVASARLYATAMGVYAMELNGQAVGDEVLAPGWTSYHHRIQYQTHDVAALLKQGKNAIGAMLADGWYRGYLGWDSKRNHYGNETALRAQLHIIYTDGRIVVVGTDRSWTVSTDGPWRSADIYNGEIYDARRALEGWSTADFDATHWQDAALHEAKPVALIAPQGPAVKRIEELPPTSISQAPNGEIVVDMGQNLVGWVRLQAQGTAGTEIVIRHAEVLDEKGNLYTDNLRGAAQTNRYILAGNDSETYEPRFTFQGFRYVGIKGYPGKLNANDISAVVLHSDMATTGNWKSSNALLNQLYSNISWGQRGNFLDVPTDCPQRDERLGWTGDAQVFAPTAAFNMDVAGFFAKWLADLAADQKDDGSVPDVVPSITGPGQGVAGWADAATVVPWAMYRAYGDESLLRRQLESMASWVDYVTTQADDDLIWRPGWQYGDWLAPQFNDVFAPYRAITGTDLIATAYFAHSTHLVAQAAEALGYKERAKRYHELFTKVREAFRSEFVTPSGRLAYETQTSYVLALDFELLPEADRASAAARLAADVQSRGNHLTTGFLGTPALTRVLSDYGQTEVAYDLLTQTTYPSWLYPVKFGATTIWERWDAVRPDGTFQSPEMTSFNHYAYGAVGNWMVNVVAGLDQSADSLAYKRLHVHPQPGGRLMSASASLATPYGPAASAWSFDGDRFTLAVTVAPNTSAQVYLPMAAGLAVTESDVPLQQTDGIRSIGESGSDLVLELGSGNYKFSYQSRDLLARAADYAPFTADTSLADILGDPIALEVLNAAIPGFNNGSQIPVSMAAQSPNALKRYDTRGMITAFIDALPAIDEKRRAALFTIDK